MSAVGTGLCAVLDSKVAKENGATDAADADTTDTAKDFIDQQSLGSGAYVQTSWTPKSEIVMEANPNYWRGAPKIDKIIIKNVTDPTTVLQLLQKGEVDIVYMLDRDLVEQAKADPNIQVVAGQMFNMDYIAMTSNPELSKPLSNKLVRQAVLKAIDYEGISQGIMSGFAISAPVVIPSGILGVDPNAKPVPTWRQRKRCWLKRVTRMALKPSCRTVPVPNETWWLLRSRLTLRKLVSKSL